MAQPRTLENLSYLLGTCKLQMGSKSQPFPSLKFYFQPVTADLKSRKAMCIVAVNCHCKITQDWCSNRDKKKTKSDKKKDTKEGEESDE
eukprot:Seg5561.1 transcript_id=Seg5561.1/GoldUCD/mRNA.D3Y31 product="hypothetical protein" protein_id=Seg5561.1/GoldUCD/D3Y31